MNTTATAMFVSVNKSFQHGEVENLDDLSPYVQGYWGTTVTKANSADRVLAVLDGYVVAAWRSRGAYPDATATYKVSNGDIRPRVGLSLGPALPVLPAYQEAVGSANMRRGCHVMELDSVDPLGAERTEW